MSRARLRSGAEPQGVKTWVRKQGLGDGVCSRAAWVGMSQWTHHSMKAELCLSRWIKCGRRTRGRRAPKKPFKQGREASQLCVLWARGDWYTCLACMAWPGTFGATLGRWQALGSCCCTRTACQHAAWQAPGTQAGVTETSLMQGVSCCQCCCRSMHYTAVAANRGGAQTHHPVPGICPAAW